MNAKGRDFWTFHRARLNAMGCELEWHRIARGSLERHRGENADNGMGRVVAVIKGSDLCLEAVRQGRSGT